MAAVSAVHEEVQADAERQERDQNPVPGEDVKAVLVGQQQAGNGQECNQDNAGARLPEAAGGRKLVT
jgi:hypothetical protein